MKTFSKLTRLEVYSRDNARCTQCGEDEYFLLEIHHIIANTKLNRKLYGHLIQSRDNGILCCHKCHDKHALWDGELRRQLRKEWKDEINSKTNKLTA